MDGFHTDCSVMLYAQSLIMNPLPIACWHEASTISSCPLLPTLGAADAGAGVCMCFSTVICYPKKKQVSAFINTSTCSRSHLRVSITQNRRPSFCRYRTQRGNFPCKLCNRGITQRAAVNPSWGESSPPDDE